MMDVYRSCLGCGEPTPASRCASCQVEVDQRTNQRRAAAGTLGASWQWRQTSRAVRRAQRACVVCGSTVDLTVDHIVPRTAGGTDHPSNLRTLCRSHNAAKGARP